MAENNILGVTISLRDRFTQPLDRFIQKITGVQNSLDQLVQKNRMAFDTSLYQQAEIEMGGISKSIPMISNSLEESAQKQERLNRTIEKGITPADQLAKNIGLVAKTYLSIHALKEVTELGDELTTLRSRINIMNDGLQSTEEITQRIRSIAVQTGTGYLQTGELVTALGIGAEEAFGSTERLLVATENLQKMLVIDSTPLAEVNFLLTDIKHAMEQGTLDAQHFRAIEMHLPSFAKILAKELGVSTGELKKMISAGEVTSEVLAKTLINAQGIEEQFTKMDMTFGRAVENLKTVLITGLSPALINITQTLTKIIQLATGVGNTFIKHWDVISPILLMAVSAFTPFIAAVTIATTQQKLLTLATKINTGAILMGRVAMISKAVATSIYNGATLKSIPSIIAATAAQWGYNYALLANPITWVVSGVIAFIGVLALLKYSVEQLTGVHISVIGTLKAIWMGFVTTVSNYFLFFKNQIQYVADFLSLVFVHPLEAVQNLFKSTFQNLINYYGNFFNEIIRVINFLIQKSNQILKTNYQTIQELELKDNDYESVTGVMKKTYLEQAEKEKGINSGVGAETGINKGVLEHLENISQNTKSIEEQLSEKDREKLLSLAENKAISSLNQTTRNTKNEIQIDVDHQARIEQKQDIEELANEISKRIANKIIEEMSNFSELP